MKKKGLLGRGGDADPISTLEVDKLCFGAYNVRGKGVMRRLAQCRCARTEGGVEKLTFCIYIGKEGVCQNHSDYADTPRKKTDDVPRLCFHAPNNLAGEAHNEAYAEKEK
jgi:hypothetical protein